MADTRTGPPSVHPIKEKQWQFQKRMEDHYHKRGSRYLPFSIEPMPHERQRLIKPMTAEERALRKQWVQDQVLSPNEPRNVPEVKPMNGFRKFYRKPWDKIFEVMRPIVVSCIFFMSCSNRGCFDRSRFSLGHFSLGHFSMGHFSLGHFSMGHFSLGHFSMGHFSQGHFGQFWGWVVSGLVGGSFRPIFWMSRFSPESFLPKYMEIFR